MSKNYDSYKRSTGLKDSEIFFIVPNSETIEKWDGSVNYYWWAVSAFQKCVFFGPKGSVENHIDQYVNHRIVVPQFTNV